MWALLKEYKESLKRTKRLKEESDEADLKTIQGMIRDLEYSIQWMETGRMSGAKRAIESRGVYDNTVFLDGAVFESMYADPKAEKAFQEIDNKDLSSKGAR